jgi:ribose transport system ATP-binding protein
MSTAVEPVWEVRHISKTFPGVRAVDGASLALRAGEVHALVGENGSGKSTLAKCLAGTYQPDEGEILHRGRVVQLRDPNAAKSLGVATFYQELSLVPSLSVAENVHLGRLPGKAGFVSWTSARRRAIAALRRLEVSIDPDRIVGDLSVAEQQLVEIARAISTGEITLLILDEPAAALGPDEVERLHGVVRVLARDAAVLYISHRLEEVLSVAEVVSVIRDGRIVVERRTAEVSVREVVRMMIGGELEEYFHRVDATVDEQPLLEARDIRTKAGVHGVDLALRRGEVLGLGGLIGSGRTEIARALFGADRLSGGEVRLEGRPLQLRSPADAIAAGIGYLAENRKADGLFVNLLAPPNITIARLDGISSGPLLALGREWRRARALVRELRLSPGAERRNVAFLSGGNQQKLVLGRWLFAEARVLILDEPTQGVDVGAKAEIHRLMVELAGRGLAIVMISSELPEVLGMSDRIAVMHGGTVVATLDREAASQESIMELALGHVAEGAVMP